MPAGIQVWSDGGGFVQIDSAYRSLRMTQKGQVTPNGNFATGDQTWLQATIDVYGSYPIVAYRASQYTFVVPTYVGPGHYQWTFISMFPANPVSYWVFNEQLPNPSNFGFEIFKEDGQTVVFDANDMAAKITDFWTYTGPPLNVNQSTTHPMQSTWAVAPCQSSTITLKSPAQQITMAYAMTTIGGTLTVASFRVYIGALTNMGAQASALTNPSYVLVDVAGY